MTDSKVIYKVLWVDDDENIVQGIQLAAEEYDLQLDHYSCWENAEKVLKKKFDEYSAIILDANCKIKEGDMEQEFFLNAVMPSLTNLFGEKQKFLPWYIFSAGTMSNFELMIRGAQYQHATHVENWGQMLYMKDAPNDADNSADMLFKNIHKVAGNQSINSVLYKHSEIFSIMGKGKLLDARARELMLKMLCALYFPEENIKYEYAGNPIRKVLEYLFHSANKLGLVPDECYIGGKLKAQLASLYMAGADVSYINSDKSKIVRYGKAGPKENGYGGDAIFDEHIAKYVNAIRVYSSEDSHTNKDVPYYIDEHNKELFFSHLMLLCHVIKWYGIYAKEHDNVHDNLLMKQLIRSTQPKEMPTNFSSLKHEDGQHVQKIEHIIPSKEELIGKQYLIMNDNGIAVCGSCKLSKQFNGKTGVIKISNLVDNLEEDNVKYPYIITEIM